MTIGLSGDRLMTDTALARRLGVVDAVVIGLSAMIGAGVYAAFAPAARAAGSRSSWGWASPQSSPTATPPSSAQLAAQYPSSGGTYVYGRERLGEWWGFLAGWGFVVGKTALCAAMALTFAAYAVDGPEWMQRLAALAAVVVLTTVNYHGITKTSGLARVLHQHHRGRAGRRRCRDRDAPGRDVARGRRGRLVHRRCLRCAPVSRSALLRVRGVRAHRHPRRGGTRP